jgi:hypothetical protein
MQAGARAVVASLWDVNDEDSRRLMRSFYGHLRTGATPDEALRQAQIDLMRIPGTIAKPGGWGAFVIAGDTARPVLESTLLSASGAATGAIAVVSLFLLVVAVRTLRP